MPPTDVPPELQQHPVYIYALLIVIVVTVLALASSKVREALGPIGTWISTRQERATERKRTQLVAQGKLDDVRLKSAEDRIEFLENELADERAEKLHYSEEARTLSRQVATMQRKLDELTDQVKALRRELEPHTVTEES